ncbi:5,6-dimethylbenzimidazole synthase [Gluconobacter oxydans]|uniref:5,6-dimethylbenzimidazole synthase n=1 Tax=Gluconobacter thailandicus TaxID=257438 RepID=UPI0002998FA4|nr:5,6-dimethylbenzimidazole synthase [Gluconobacter thailandicus]AFW02466.1 Cob(II)yrinic acid a,c-diamide reductase [Gluconobacter oxydans H24]ANQ42033.1 5,6-dimethylbenzimidazole synthase [Gluconobacter oxydans]
MTSPVFSDEFRLDLERLFTWRRDVRHFRRDPVPHALLDDLLQASTLAPSVGLSEPWRFVLVEDQARKAAVRNSFQMCNARALEGYDGEQAAGYAALKLAGLDDAPHHVAVFCETVPDQGHGLGQATMPETTTWSAVMAIHTFWLAATASGIGLGWVSILDPDTVSTILEAEPGWDLVAYLCVGYPMEQANTPELERMGWEKRNPERRQWIRR